MIPKESYEDRGCREYHRRVDESVVAAQIRFCHICAGPILTGDASASVGKLLAHKLPTRDCLPHLERICRRTVSAGLVAVVDDAAGDPSIAEMVNAEAGR